MSPEKKYGCINQTAHARITYRPTFAVIGLIIAANINANII